MYDLPAKKIFFALPCLLPAAMLCQSLIAQESIDFNRQIRPLLSRHCITCHGPDEGDRAADLRLDTYEGATDYSIVPGDADGSEFFERISTDDEGSRMPPADHAARLKPAEVMLLKRWIDQGAKYDPHWAFVAIEEPPIPVHRATGGTPRRLHNEVDYFIVRKLEQAGLSQNPPAKPAALVRRTCLDLTGVPPVAHDQESRDLIDTYLDSPTGDRFEKIVDRLLETPAYAEHAAATWLDLARYADTCGYSGDEQRDIWPWRDWLIRSIAEKKSYRTLSIEMLAGDMLPHATDDQKLATAFHRNTLSNNEGGTDDEEFRVIAVKDRLNTTLNVWMGLTVRCAECHSHKYDPISHREYYQLLAYFNQTADSDHRDDRPKLGVRPVADPALIARHDTKIKDLESRAENEVKVWRVIEPVSMDSRNGTQFELLDNGAILAKGKNPDREEYQLSFAADAGSVVSAIRLEAIPHLKHNGRVGRSNDGAFLLSQIRIAQLDPDGLETILPIAKAANDFNQPNRHASKAILPEVESAGNQGWGVNHPVSGYQAHHEAIFELKQPLVATTDTQFKVYLLFDPPWVRLNMGCLRIATTDVTQAAKKYDNQQLEPVTRELFQLRTKRDARVRVPVMAELPADKQRSTFVNLRGNFRSKGEQVTAQLPAAFTADSQLRPTNRLDLAQWLFDDNNPLTARVAVNRYWSRLMGIGLVETEEDFGTQGAPPSHPQLLDYLATEFRQSDWNIRALQKKIVMSASYQQSQVVSSSAASIDPRNRLISRGPRIRLAAEVVRDQALAVAGLLSQKRHGPPVYPPNPIKNIVNAFTGGMTWQESTGEDRFRRAIYTFYKRSAPHPLFETFDISSREVCNLRRLRTNTPLQSFMTLNDITFIEAARALAQKMMAVTESAPDHSTDAVVQQIEFGIQSALYSPANDRQIEAMLALHQVALREYRNNYAAALDFLGHRQPDADSDSGEVRQQRTRHAAMTLVANAILNLDSFLNN